jgi:hypothetical protein
LSKQSDERKDSQKQIPQSGDLSEIEAQTGVGLPNTELIFSAV